MANKGKFINTTHTETITTLVDNFKQLLNNPYYLWNDKKVTIVDYIHINKEMSTLDTGSKMIMDSKGPDSPLWYDYISDFLLFGLERLVIQMEHGEFGAESGEISGEAIILPNTITPYPGDMFKIKYLKERFTFLVIGVSHDTLENGANLYKIEYKLDSILDHEKELKIKNRYTMIASNTGTEYKTILRNSSYDLIKRIEEFTYNLKIYYKSIFYSERVQSFIFNFNGRKFYDPFMTQFIMKHKLMTGADEYVYITQQLPLDNFFPVSYNNTFLRCLENEDFKNIRKYKYKAIGRFIDSKTTIFQTRIEPYFEIDFDYTIPEGQMFGVLSCFKEELFEGIERNKLYDDNNAIYNIIIKFVNGIDLDDNDMDILDLDMHNNIILFYALPCIIYCLENYIKRIMVDEDK